MEAQAHFLRGAISILLGILCIHDEPTRTAVLSQIRAHGMSRKASLQKLFDTIQEFVGLLSTVLSRASEEVQLPSLGTAARSSPDPPGQPSSPLSSPIKNAGKGRLDDGLHLAQAVLQGLEPLIK